MTRAVLTGITLLSLLAIAGCTQPQVEVGSPSVEEPAVEDTSEGFVYEFTPYATFEQVKGWPVSATPAAYFVSGPIDSECHWSESSSLIGPAISESIDLGRVDSLEGLACGFTATPLSDRDDVLDEVAWRVDEGVGALVAAYAASVFPEGDLDCELIEVPALSPGLSVTYLGSWYVVRPAALACPETVAQIAEGITALQLTEVLRHTTTYDEYVARGF